MIQDNRGIALRYKGAEAFSSLKAHFLHFFGALPQSRALCLTSLKALSVCLSLVRPPSLRLSHPLAVNAEREREGERGKGMTEHCNKELLILSMEESESAGRKQEVRFQVIDQTGWHEEMLVC